MMVRRHKRSAYTLLEILLALAIAVVLLTAVYGAIGYQLRQAQAGRDAVGEATLSRNVLTRVEGDVVSSLALCDPARYRNLQKAAQSTKNQQGTATSGGQATTGQATTGQATTGQAATTGQGATTGQQASGATQTQSADSTDDTTGQAGLNGPVVLPFGAVGNNNVLTLYVSKVPGELYNPKQGEQGQPLSDLRRITYWLGDNGQGLCRHEMRVVTSDDAMADPLTPPGVADPNACLMAPEVKILKFRYFDGASWVTEWDSRTLGGDKITAPTGDEIGTPVGSPRAIEVKIGVLPPGGKDGDTLKYFRQVIFIRTSNGVTQASAPGSP